MAKSLLQQLSDEAAEAREDMGGAKTQIVRKGEEREQDEPEELEEEDSEEEPESKQDIDNEEQEEDERDEDEEEDDDESEIDDRRVPNETAAQIRINRRNQDTIRELQEKVASYEKADTDKKQKALADEIGEISTELATEFKTNDQFVNKLLSKAVDIAERRISSKLPPQELAEEFESRQESNFFDSEWRTFGKDLAVQYPNAKHDQLEQARELMDELSHDPEIGGRIYKDSKGKDRLAGFPLDYILFKNKQEFDAILSSKKRHSLESANVADLDEVDEETDRSTSKGLDALDKKYNRLTEDSSGLRRGRRPRSRTI